MSVTIGGIEIGGDNPCRFVFEVSNAHNGKLDLAHKLIDAAKDANADFVKFQAYRPSELLELRGDGPAPEPWASEGHTMSSLYEEAQTPLEWLPELFQHARDVGIVPFSSVFGLESLAMLERCACPAFKIARLDNTARPLIQAVLSRQKPVLVSTSGREALPYECQRHDDHDLVARLFCAEGYPTLAKDVHLPYSFGPFGSKMGGYLGMSSHCMDPDLPLLAVARGCAVIEMHGMLDDVPSKIESNVSLTASQFAAMIQRVRNAEAMLSA